MYRLVTSKLQEWFNDSTRKPLVLKGARQVGKTFTVNQFGHHFVERQTGAKYHYLDLKREKELHSIFRENQNPKKILEFIELHQHIKIDPKRDLLFFDEIQDCPHAISSLKYFQQDLASLRLIVAGSHLGLIKNEDSFPVGKVNFLSMFPMTFYEFLLAIEEPLCLYLNKFELIKPKPLPTLVHDKLSSHFLTYLAIGGLPEVVNIFQKLHETDPVTALIKARQAQNELITGYESDFSKYSGTVNANHIHSVFQAIPKQLASNLDESTSKFKFTGVIPKQKGFDRIIGPLTWLSKSRLCIKSCIAKKSGHPLSAYTADNVFKAFYLDVGLLNASLGSPMEALIQNNLDCYKGYIVENFVAQELYSVLDHDLTSWQEGESEIEFLITVGNNIIPIEVKSANKFRRAKSLMAYIQRYSPKQAYKLSLQNVGSHDQFLTLPLYLCSKILEPGK